MVYFSILYHIRALHFNLPPLFPHPGVFTSPLVTESIHTCHDIISYGLDVNVRRRVVCLEECSWYHSPRHARGRAVRPRGHVGRGSAVRVRRSPWARWDRGTSSRRGPRRGPTRSWSGRGSRWSPAVRSWAGGWRPRGEETEETEEMQTLLISQKHQVLNAVLFFLLHYLPHLYVWPISLHHLISPLSLLWSFSTFESINLLI